MLVPTVIYLGPAHPAAGASAGERRDAVDAPAPAEPAERTGRSRHRRRYLPAWRTLIAASLLLAACLAGTAQASTGSSSLTAGQQLTAGQYLVSPSGQYRLVMQGDGNLVEYQGAGALWSSGTAGDTGAWAVMQGDGNLVVYQNGVAKWNSGTYGFSGSDLQLQDDGDLVVYQGQHAVWASRYGYLGNRLLPGITLSPGGRLISGSHQYQLIMQGDGNLVLYHGGVALWSTGTAGDSGASVTMQTDGNLVVYQNGVARWNSGTYGHAGANLVLQDDSSLVVYQGSTPLWDWQSGLLGGGQGSGAAFCNSQGGLSTSRVSIDNVYPCANRNIYDSFGYQCVEFSVRFEAAHYRERLVSGPGRNVVMNLHNQDGVAVQSPGPGHLPAPGDVISMWGDPNQDWVGHTGVVAAVNVSNGYGTITIYDENGILLGGQSTGVSTIDVTNWQLSVPWSPPYHYTYFDWTVQA